MSVEVASIALRDIADVGNNPFSGWPVLGHNWTLGIKPKLKPGKGYGCFVAPDLPVGIPLTNGGTNCPPGFYCPFLIPNNSDTSPVLCPLNTYCTMVRLLGNRCMPQGMYEPMICWYGFYCPDPQTIIACPEGHHCISGVTAPKKCRMFSICPTGTIAEANYAYILLFLLIDFILFIYLMVLRSFDLVKQGLPALSVIPGFLTVMKYNRRQIRKRKHRSEHEQVVNIEPLTNYVHEGAESQYCEKVTATEDSTNNEPQRLSDSTYNMDISNGLTATKTKPPLVHIDESQLDIDYPDASDSEEQQESLSLKSTAELARLELCSMVSNVSPLLEAFHSAFNGLENLRMNLKFNDLRYSMGDKVILDSVSGEIKAGRMTAILGPSGAGKTTFINVLMGKVARTSGDLMINGIQAEMHTFRKIIGYVPQDDIMLRELTVKEVVQYSARTRLPRDWSSKKVDDLVDAILKVLNLEHIAHTFIGDELDRGISGGQRKRVNIAMELASAPLALILDEPTSGLDSTSALKVAKILRSISRVGLTVVSIIHQPRIEIFNTFDDVLMIVPGGKTAYFGPVKKAVLYFESFLGFQFDKGSNPADVIMDILSGRGKMKEKGPTLKPETIAMIWKESGINFISQKDKQTLFSDVHAVQSMKMIVLSRGASFLQQCWLSYQRSLTQQARTARALFLEILVGMIAGLI
ncbi:P-loop containing nucleoside triphosphate hydrolase protein, partial [Rhizoclosmatium globosum]